MDDDKPRELSEFSRVKDDTSTFKTFRRALGFGSATRVVKRSLQSDGASPESVALAMVHKQQVSRARSEIRAAPLRTIAAVFAGAVDALRYANGAKTSQALITDQLAAKAELRRDASALKASDSSNANKKLLRQALDHADRVNAGHSVFSPLSKGGTLQKDLQKRLIQGTLAGPNRVGADDHAARRTAALNELRVTRDALAMGARIPRALSEQTVRYLRDQGLNPDMDPLTNLASLARPARSGAPTQDLGLAGYPAGLADDRQAIRTAHQPLGRLPSAGQHPSYGFADMRAQYGPTQQWPAATNSMAPQPVFLPRPPQVEHLMQPPEQRWMPPQGQRLMHPAEQERMAPREWHLMQPSDQTWMPPTEHGRIQPIAPIAPQPMTGPDLYNNQMPREYPDRSDPSMMALPNAVTNQTNSFSDQWSRGTAGQWADRVPIPRAGARIEPPVDLAYHDAENQWAVSGHGYQAPLAQQERHFISDASRPAYDGRDRTRELHGRT